MGQELLLPAEIILIIANHLPFKTYIQLSQTCTSMKRILTTTNAIGYLNQRFKFGKDTGSLLLFVHYNVIFVPHMIRQIVLNHFIKSTENDVSFVIKCWSMIHAFHCSDPGRFMTVLLTDDSQEERKTYDGELRRKIVLEQQNLFANQLIDCVIESQTPFKSQVCKSKTYRSVFEKLVKAGDLRAVENCLRNLGSPTNYIELSDSDFNSRYPLTGQEHVKKPIDLPFDVICQTSQYLFFNAHDMRALTETLLGFYRIKVNQVASPFLSRGSFNSASHSTFTNHSTVTSHSTVTTHSTVTSHSTYSTHSPVGRRRATRSSRCFHYLR